MKKLIFLLLLSLSGFAQTVITIRAGKVIIVPEGSTVVITTPVGSTTATPVVTSDPTPTPTGSRVAGAIPFESVNLYQRNSAAQPLDAMFTNSKTSDTRPVTNGQIFRNFDNIYDYPSGTNVTIDRVQFALPYGGDGFAKDQTYVYATDRTTGVEELMWQTSSVYNKGQIIDLALPKSYNPKSLRIYVVNNATPIFFKFIGSYTNIPTFSYPALTQYPLKNQFGTNIFLYDILATDAKDFISPYAVKRMKELGGATRQYLDWEWVEPTQGNYYYSPTPHGGWYVDSVYMALNKAGIKNYPDLKTVPDWLLATYPDTAFSNRGFGRFNEVSPAPFGSNLEDPTSYRLSAKMAFQFSARYGHNPNVPINLIETNTTKQGTYASAPSDVKKVGLGLIEDYEFENERDKFWKGTLGFQTGRQFAANLSAVYDGNKNTMGAGIGVKNADPSLRVILGGIAQTKPDYLADFVSWVRDNRGYRADGKLDLPVDVVAYHVYIGNSGGQGSSSTFGSNIEESFWLSDYTRLSNYVRRYMNNIPIITNEAGYDWNADGSKYGIPKISGKDTLETHADWTLRQALVMGRYGTESTQWFMMRDLGRTFPAGVFGSSGLVNYNYTRREIGDYIVQVNKLMPNAVFQTALREDSAAYAYQYTDLPAIGPKYIIWSGTHVNRKATYNLSVPGATSVVVHALTVRANDATRTTVTGAGTFAIPISETPVIVIPNTSTRIVAPIVRPYDAAILAVADSTLSRPDTTIMSRVTISNATDLRTFLTSAQTNKYVTLTNGTYTGEFQQTGNFTNVYIKAQTKGSVIFTRSDYSTNWIFTGAHNVTRFCMDGLTFRCDYVSSTVTNPMVWSNELVAFDGLEIKRCSFSGTAAGNYNALGMIQYSTGSASGATSTNIFIHNNDIFDVPRSMEFLSQGYDYPRISGFIFSHNRIERMGLNNAYGAGVSFSGLIKNVLIYNNVVTDAKFVGIELVNTQNVIARSNRITSQVGACSGYGISDDGRNSTKAIYIDGNTHVDVVARPFYVYDSKNVYIEGGTWKGKQKVDMKVSNSGFAGMNVQVDNTTSDYGWTVDGASTANQFIDNTIKTATTPFTRPMQFTSTTSANTYGYLRLMTLRRTGATYPADAKVLDSGSNNTLITLGNDRMTTNTIYVK